MKRSCITEVELKRYRVLTDVREGRIDLKTASEVLGLSYRHTLRLRDRFNAEGFEGLLRKAPPKPPNLKVSPELINEIVSLRKSLYEDFNILHFQEKLRGNHGIEVSYESLRQILVKEGLHEPRKRRRVYRRRRRMPRAGMLVQMDSSQHRWLEAVKEPWWLVAMIDDAERYVYGRFYPSDTTWANMEVIRGYIEQRGLFMALYVDKASHFKTTRHGGVHYDVSVDQPETQIQRALRELNIEIVYANSPQAKGRIERLFRFLQDRLIKEMALRGIKTYEEANRFLEEEFLPWYNNEYTLSVESAYRQLDKEKDLDLIFSIKHPRKVKRDNTIDFRGSAYQLLPLNGIKSFSGKVVEVCEHRDGTIDILFESKKVSCLKITDRDNPIEGDKTEILNKRQYLPEKRKKKTRTWKPPKNHPWRKNYKFKHNNVTFQTGN